MARLVNLDVNDSGSWRRVSQFDLDDFEDGALEHAAEKLLELSTNTRLRARIIMPGLDTTPLVTWSREDGWREWVHPRDQQNAFELSGASASERRA